jgi:hypothetical protein
VAATDDVIAGRARNAFCAVRPPGHHATRDEAMGFCFFNNVAVAARHALDVHGLERVAIIDFDVHHGNGTEDIIAGDDRVLMCSFFQHPLYPYNGAVPKGTNMVNVPVAAYTRGPAIRETIEAMWMPALEEFRPQMIFISAGFDAHREDDLGQMGLVEADYEWITRQLVAWRSGIATTASCRAWKAATASARWRAAWPRTCACWPTWPDGLTAVTWLRCPAGRRLRPTDPRPAKAAQALVELRLVLACRQWPGCWCACCGVLRRQRGTRSGSAAGSSTASSSRCWCCCWRCWRAGACMRWAIRWRCSSWWCRCWWRWW